MEEYDFAVFSILEYVNLMVALPKNKKQHVIEGWMEGFKDFFWDVVKAWDFSPS